jgi:hypothetical protein
MYPLLRGSALPNAPGARRAMQLHRSTGTIVLEDGPVNSRESVLKNATNGQSPLAPPGSETRDDK